MNLVVAVSGGVDSVVLLDALAKTKHELVVAHFDHGIRDDSAADARFVEALADRYSLPFVGRREGLGVSASEDIARMRRYGFLSTVANEHGATIVTAHHQGDVCETIALNIARGTGWRGLAVFGNSHVLRPLVRLTKQQLYDYALVHQLEWVEDSTNASDEYARNRMRRRLTRLGSEATQKLIKLWDEQVALRQAIDHELEQHTSVTSRYFLTMIDPAVAYEILNAQLKKQLGHGVTRPHLARLLLAIKTAQPGTRHDITGGAILEVGKDNYVVRP